MVRPTTQVNPAQTEISRAIRESREQMGLSQEELAKLIPIKRQLLEEFEEGITTPTVPMLARLSKALGGEDLAARFPYPKPTDPLERAKPENMVMRLQHLINIVTNGHQTNFVTQAGIGASTFSKIMKGERGLSQEVRNHLTAYLPNLDIVWVLSGGRKPFGSDPAPLVNPKVAREPMGAIEEPAERPALAEQAGAALPTVAVEDRSQELPTIEAIRVLAGEPVPEVEYTYDEEGQSFPSVGPLVDFLEYIAEHNCGLTPEQVRALLEHF